MSFRFLSTAGSVSRSLRSVFMAGLTGLSIREPESGERRNFSPPRCIFPPPAMSPNSTLPRKRLRVSIGPDRFHHIIASVNGLPTEIDTPLFVGRVLVLVKDFAGVTPDGSPSINEHAYFHGRSRKFAILVEGRFKAREGTPHYTGEEVQFGSDFGEQRALESVERGS